MPKFNVPGKRTLPGSNEAAATADLARRRRAALQERREEIEDLFKIGSTIFTGLEQGKKSSRGSVSSAESISDYQSRAAQKFASENKVQTKVTDETSGQEYSLLNVSRGGVPYYTPTAQPQQAGGQQNGNFTTGQILQAAAEQGVYLTQGEAERYAKTGQYVPAGYKYGGKGGSEIPLPGGMSPERYQSLLALSENPESALRQVAATLLPYMSPDGQKSVSQYLAEGSDELAKAYRDYEVAPITTAQARSDLLSKEKAVMAKQALDNMLNQLNIEPEDLGEGYKFLTNVLDKLEQTGTDAGVPFTTAQYSEFSRDLLDELDAAKNDNEKGAFEPIARFLVTPYVDGQNVFRLTRNRKLFS